MLFSELHETVPYAKGGKEKILRYRPYDNVTLAMPGRHQLDTVPIGGDFVVMITDPVFNNRLHQFTHNDIFQDVELKRDAEYADFFIQAYADVVCGTDPDDYDFGDAEFEGINPTTFLQAGQCLAVAEHRRYSVYENKLGGRYLPLRFAAGIAEGLWSAADAANLQKKGRPGVEILERQNGVPVLTKELMGG